MKKHLFYFLAASLGLFSCSSSTEDNITTDFGESDEIIEAFVDLKLGDYGSREEIETSLEYITIDLYQESENEAIRDMAKRYMDSVNVLIKTIEAKGTSALITYAEKKGWDKLSKEEFQSLEKTLMVQKDKFDKYQTYRHPSSPEYVNYAGFFLFYVKGDTKIPNMYLRAQYRSDEWLFIKNAKISTGDNMYDMSDYDFGWETDHSAGNIFEWGTIRIQSFDILLEIIQNKEGTIRYVGSQYYDDVDITKNQIDHMEMVLKSYYGNYLKK
jgi:hypothetical protein